MTKSITSNEALLAHEPHEFKGLALSVQEACRLGGISINRFYDEVRARRLVARKMGRRTIVLRADLEQWLSRLPELDLKNNPSTPTVRNLNPIGRRKRGGEVAP